MPDFPPLTILEEFLLLALDDESGEFWPLPRSIFDCAAGGAVLMDLMQARRVDCDASCLTVVEAAPTGDDILDRVLNRLALLPGASPLSVADQVRMVAEEGESLCAQALQRLVGRGILKREDRKILWVFGARRYPLLQDKDVREVKLRLLGIIFSDAVPDPRDAMLAALADAGGLFAHILSAHELAHAAPRLRQVARLDLLGRAVREIIGEIETTIAMSSGLR